ncbi:response regulator transcription factor [Longispora albida]|uniref:response regulator transcription factor n=1 Tax=Longispora albida TaxID=203523 RepID=UPI00036F9434|nr:response regulator transcription factor [Longispora albida]
MNTTTVVLADDEELTRAGLRYLLSAEPDLDVVGEAADGAEAVALARRLEPDVVVMDVRMPVLDGLAATERLRGGPSKVLVLTTFENDDYVYEAIRAGAAGFLVKRARPEQLAQAIRVVAGGESVLFPEAIRALAAARPAAAPKPLPLTGREGDVLRLMATGLSNQDIAGRLFVSLETVKTHVGNVLAKLGAENRTQAVIMAYEAGFVVPGASSGSGSSA